MSNATGSHRSAAMPAHEINPAPDVKVVPLPNKKHKEVQKAEPRKDQTAPTKGIPAFSHMLKQGTRRVVGEVGISYQPKPTTPNRAERYERAKIRLEEVKSDLFQVIVVEGEQRTIGWFNSKGGAGKTPGSAVSACVISWATNGEEILLIDANENAGTTADRMGVSNKMTLKRVVAMHDLDNETMVKRLPRHHKYNVRVVASDQSDATDIDTNTFITTAKRLKKNVNSVVIDTGNGTAHPANKGSALVADTLVFSALWEDHFLEGAVNASMKSLASTMREYAKLGLESKVQRAFIAISKVREAKTLQEAEQIKQEVMDALEHHFNMVSASESEDEDENAEKMSLSDYGFTVDRLIVVPYSSHIASNMAVDLDVDTIGINTLVAHGELLLEIYKQPLPSLEVTTTREQQPMPYMASVGQQQFQSEIPSLQLVPTQVQPSSSFEE
jgi:MinD-like ATPase involved in chromosome partitioning or flagellar assembly